MRNATPVLIPLAALLLTTPASPEEGIRLRYRGLGDPVRVTIDQDIYIRGPEPIATRDFAFELAGATESSDGALTVTVERARASYSAHDRTRRLGTRHIGGRTFSLPIVDGGRGVGPPDDREALAIDVGPPVRGGYSIAQLLGETLPTLPESPIAVGTTWTTRRPVRSLEGWGWGSGELASRHRVTELTGAGKAIRARVTSESEARLGPVADEPAFTGTLKRTTVWTFDPASGTLLSLSMEQESSGSCPLPQGEVSFRQETRVELGPAADRGAAP